MTLIYKINDLEKKIPYEQWKALKKEFVEFAKEKKQLETNIEEAKKLNEQILDMIDNGRSKEQFVPYLKKQKIILERGKE